MLLPAAVTQNELEVVCENVEKTFELDQVVVSVFAEFTDKLCEQNGFEITYHGD